MSASYPAAASWNNLPSEFLIGIIAGTLIYVKNLLVFFVIQLWLVKICITI